MTLPQPVLDNRTFAQLVSESIGQINRLSPEWTDYNASDPGITLIELMAWLSEQNLYRTDRITPEMSRAFLRLVGVEPRPPTVATTTLLLTTTSAGAITLPDRMQVADPLIAVVFESRDPITISPAKLVQVLAGAGLQDVTADNILPFDPVKDDRVGTFQPFGSDPKPGDALYLGFDRSLGVAGAKASLHLWTRTPAADALATAALLREWEREKIATKHHCPPGTVPPEWRRHYAVDVVWEYFAGSAGWHGLSDVTDDTRSLTLTGFVHFTLPADHVAGGPGAFWFIRCRIVKGTFECATWADRIGLNAVTFEHAVSIDAPEVLGNSRGHASERYVTSLSPVVAGSTRLVLASGAQRDQRWAEALTWDLVGPHDAGYLLEPDLGRVTSGNGMRGAVFSSGWDVLFDYRVGGGVDGNIVAGQLTDFPANPWNVGRVLNFTTLAPQIAAEQAYPALGGAAAETLPAAEARALVELSAPTTTVTLNDFASLALETPGVPVARAKALANHHPVLPCFDASGVITVIVVPNCPGPAPMPGEGFLRAVQDFLYPRRNVTTEIHVIAPTYVKVTVAAKLQTTSSDNDPAVLAASAQQALDSYFNPLFGGPDGTGWPIGRAVYRTEVMTILAALPGALTVSNLTLAAGDEAPTCDNLTICAGDLVESGRHNIDVIIMGTPIFSRSRERECS